MNDKSKKVGDFIKETLYYAKCLEYLIENHKLTLNGGLKFNDKKLANQALSKIDSAINDITFIVKNENVRKLIINDIQNVDLTNQMLLVHLILTLKEEVLTEIVDLVEDYLLQKSKTDDNTIKE